MIEVGDKLPQFTFKTAKIEGNGACPLPTNITTDSSTRNGHCLMASIFRKDSGLGWCSWCFFSCESFQKLKDKGIDTVAVVSVNDAFVLANWAVALSAGSLLMLADGNGDFAKLLGMQQDLSAAGMGLRSKRFALVVKDGVVLLGVGGMVPSEMYINAGEVFQRFELDPVYGFVSCLKRAELKLPPAFSAWEDIAKDLSALTSSGKLRGIIDNRIPNGLAKPWIKVSEAIDILPIINYAAAVLFNFRPVNPTEPLSLDGSIDETWFYLVSIAVDCQSGRVLTTAIEIANAFRRLDYSTMHLLLLQLAELIVEIEEILCRMYEENIPAVFFQRIRRSLAGWLNDENLPDGVYYGDETEGRQYAGASAAQSPVIHALDIILGVNHKAQDSHIGESGVTSAGAYLLDMRNYMAKNHRDTLKWLGENVCIRSMVTDEGISQDMLRDIKDAYNLCLQKLRSFRNTHLSMVSNYIVVQAQKSNSIVKGTGGSNPVPFLKNVRSHMDNLPLS
ncbi:Indoleamine 2,3-dioxygenase domain-containing protein [Paramicrosporidium saccamoebae]|uniref:Indoleamine 2,3-dioxygenase domain-containing protein n=1 Tax=Paramicrosporidium saccamoebae TaxID=1246581 RepID=A0A2H9TL35_9FUNG|nr:Indoleamine 2,3-dioxygenase domain-containing protein [Paramicrosporidium saccamoebae]